MKDIISGMAATLLVALSAVSCEERLPAPQIDEGEIVALSVHVGGDATKAVGVAASDESAISSVQIFVFDSDGKFECQKTSDGTSVEIGCTVGRKTIWAVANAPAMAPSSLSELESATSLLSDNAVGAFVMGGSSVVEVSGPSTVTLKVRRYVARVSVSKVTNGLTGVLAAKEFIVRGVYLLDVAGDCTYGAAGDPSVWFNMMSRSSCAADALISDAGLDMPVANGASNSTEHVFFPYPNPTEANANGGTWSERHTKLVVEASLGGTVCWYPVVLPVLERNKTYTISELTVTRMGSDDPDVPVEKGTMEFNITVEDWETGAAPHSETI